MTRYNSVGLTYELTRNEGKYEETLITLVTPLREGDGEKSIVVKHAIEKISQAWYYWQQVGEHVQYAFDFLSPDEREFLISGITPGEWDRIFKDEEK